MTYTVCNTVEAKAKLNELLDVVEAGKVVLISRYGKTVAKLVPASEDISEKKNEIVDLMRRLRTFHKKLSKIHGSKGDTVSILREIRKES